MMMNFVQQEQEQEREFCDKEEELQEGDEEEEEDEMMMMTRTSKLPFPSPSSSSSSSCTKYRNFLPQRENLWVGSSENSQQDYKNQEAALNFDNKIELMDLSLGNDNGTVKTSTSGGGGQECIEREHMFDKVVTPSDVGKLNRLVIPKQHAEKYFPLDSSSNEKGLLLNFEDRNGKPWRFRYSYWNSSQSYVMTKGWSRFVKEKKLDAGDIVSFQRGVGEWKHRLYIDWRRRANAPDPTSFTHLELQNQLHFPQSVRWGRLYSLPQPLSSIPRPYQQPHHHHHHQFQHLNYTIHQPYHHHHHPHHNPQYYLRPSPAGSLQIGAVHHHHQQGGDHQAAAPPPIVIDSIPVVHGRSVGKRLRLFGVNMECTTQDDFSSFSSSSSVNIPHGSSTMVGSLFSPHLPTASASASASASSLPPPSSGASISIPTSTTHQAHEFSKKGKTSLSFDLDL